MTETANHNIHVRSRPPSGEPTSRRAFLLRMGLALNAIAAALFAIPVIGYLLSPMRKFVWLSWISLGSLADFPENQTRLATYRNPYHQALGRADGQHSVLGAARGGREVHGLRD